jgi:hypothetical protein
LASKVTAPHHLAHPRAVFRLLPGRVLPGRGRCLVSGRGGSGLGRTTRLACAVRVAVTFGMSRAASWAARRAARCCSVALRAGLARARWLACAMRCRAARSMVAARRRTAGSVTCRFLIARSVGPGVAAGRRGWCCAATGVVGAGLAPVAWVGRGSAAARARASEALGASTARASTAKNPCRVQSGQAAHTPAPSRPAPAPPATRLSTALNRPAW